MALRAARNAADLAVVVNGVKKQHRVRRSRTRSDRGSPIDIVIGGDVIPGPLTILQNSPWWAYVLLGLLIWLGLQALRPRTLPIWRLTIVPASLSDGE